MINYFKLDARAEANKISAHQYDKLQTMVEFKSGSILLFPDENINNTPNIPNTNTNTNTNTKPNTNTNPNTNTRPSLPSPKLRKGATTPR